MPEDALAKMKSGSLLSDQEPALSRARVHGFSPDRFRQARVRAGWTQEDVAVAAQLDPTTVSHWETGESRPSPVTLNRAAQALGLTIGDFLVRATEGRTLAQLRQQTGLTQGEVAQRLGVPVSTWGMIERGARAVGDHRVEAVCAVLQVNSEELLESWQRTMSRRIRHARGSGA